MDLGEIPGLTVSVYHRREPVLEKGYGHTKHEHPGTMAGFTAQASYYPDDELGVVVLSNSNSTTYRVFLIENMIARMILGIEEPATSGTSPETFESFIGEHQLSDSHDVLGEFAIVERDGTLLLEGRDIYAFAFGPATFHSFGANRLIGDIANLYTYIVEFDDSGPGGTLWINGLVYKIERAEWGITG